jgi:ribose 5-phosphate isomerase A
MADVTQRKINAARAALEYVEEGAVLGIGTGSTVNLFIEELVRSGRRVPATVSSSNASSTLLRAAGMSVSELNDLGEVPVYIDGADEVNRDRHLIKGGGGALTREKIIAAAARVFVCIVDEAKLVGQLGTFPLPVEIIPMARTEVSRRLQGLGGRPVLREGFVTDNGNQILDVHGLRITDPPAMGDLINQMAGVVTVGIFARRPADVLLIGTDTGVRRL